MIYAVISDVHANETALRKVLEDAEVHGAKGIICLGDAVGYGPLPAETVALLREVNASMVVGNHDAAVLGRGNGDDFIDLAKDAVERHREALGQKDRDFLAGLPYVLTFAEAVATHGDFTDPEKFLYIEDTEDAKVNFDAVDARLAFVGHTHVPGVFLTGCSGAVYKIEPQDFVLEDEKRYIVNPGSVGYPRERNGQCFSSYVLYDSDERSISFRFLPFAVSSVMQRGGIQKRFGKWVWASGAALLCAAVAAVVWLFSPNGATTVKEVEKEVLVPGAVDSGKALTLDVKELDMSPQMKYLKYDLSLDAQAHSEPVKVKTEFLDEAGVVVDENTRTVKEEWKAWKKITAKNREKAKRVRITLEKQKKEDNVRVKEFSPRLSEAKD